MWACVKVYRSGDMAGRREVVGYMSSAQKARRACFEGPRFSMDDPRTFRMEMEHHPAIPPTWTCPINHTIWGTF